MKKIVEIKYLQVSSDESCEGCIFEDRTDCPVTVEGYIIVCKSRTEYAV